MSEIKAALSRPATKGLNVCLGFENELTNSPDIFDMICLNQTKNWQEITEKK